MDYPSSLARTYAHLFRRYVLNVAVHGGVQVLRYGSLSLFAIYSTPVEFGVMTILFLFSNYAVNASLGAVNGLKRQIPLELRNLPAEELNSILSTVFTFNILMSFIVTGAMSFFLPLVIEPISTLQLILFIVFGSIYNIWFYYQTVLIALGDLVTLRKAQTILSLSLLGLVIPSALLGNPDIFLATNIVAYALFVIYAVRHFPGIVLTKNREGLRQILRVGFPIMVAGFVFLLFQSLDRLFVSTYLGAIPLGTYAFAWLLVNAFNLLLNLGGEIVLQRAAQKYGQEKDRGALARYLLRYFFLIVGVLILCGVPLSIGIDWAISVWFTQYVGAGDLIRILLIAFISQQIVQVFGHYFPIVGRQGIYLIVLGLGTVLAAGLFSSIARMGGGIHWFAFGTLAANVVLGTFLLLSLLWDLKRQR